MITSQHPKKKEEKEEETKANFSHRSNLLLFYPSSHHHNRNQAVRMNTGERREKKKKNSTYFYEKRIFIFENVSVLIFESVQATMNTFFCHLIFSIVFTSSSSLQHFHLLIPLPFRGSNSKKHSRSHSISLPIISLLFKYSELFFFLSFYFSWNILNINIKRNENCLIVLRARFLLTLHSLCSLRCRCRLSFFFFYIYFYLILFCTRLLLDIEHNHFPYEYAII